MMLYDYERTIVALRKRPATSGENVDPDLLKIDALKTVTCTVDNSRSIYTFDQVFEADATQYEIYKKCGSPLLAHALNGYVAIVICYGQTGAGKTHTIIGGHPKTPIDHKEAPMGLLPRAALELFNIIQKDGFDYTVKMNFMEIHDEKARDILLNCDPWVPDELKHQLDTIDNITSPEISTYPEFCNMLELVVKYQNQAAQQRNSSEVTTVCIFNLIREMVVEGKKGPNVFGKLIFIEMPGSENLGNFNDAAGPEDSMTGAKKALLGLGQVLEALLDGEVVPYKASKLTTYLEKDFNQDTQICFIANVSPCSKLIRETKNTLEYANLLKLESDYEESSEDEEQMSPAMSKPKSQKKPQQASAPLSPDTQKSGNEFKIIAKQVTKMRKGLNKVCAPFEFILHPFDATRVCSIETINDLYDEMNILEDNAMSAQENFTMFTENLTAVQTVQPREDYNAQVDEFQNNRRFLDDVISSVLEWREKVNDIVATSQITMEDIFTKRLAELAFPQELGANVPQFAKDLWFQPSCLTQETPEKEVRFNELRKKMLELCLKAKRKRGPKTPSPPADEDDLSAPAPKKKKQTKKQSRPTTSSTMNTPKPASGFPAELSKQIKKQSEPNKGLFAEFMSDFFTRMVVENKVKASDVDNFAESCRIENLQSQYAPMTDAEMIAKNKKKMDLIRSMLAILYSMLDEIEESVK